MKQKETCKWTGHESHQHEWWDCECRRRWCVSYGGFTPEAQDVQFCPYCGGEIEFVWEDEEKRG
jgi:hypothetical protein